MIGIIVLASGTGFILGAIAMAITGVAKLNKTVGERLNDLL